MADSAGAGGVRVLLLEPDELTRTLVASVLADLPEPMTIDRQSLLAAGVVALERRHYDLVVTALRLPDRSGPATVAALRKAAPHTPIAVLSNDDDLDLGLRCIRAGADDYLVKARYSAEALSWAIRIVLERNRRGPPAMVPRPESEGDGAEVLSVQGGQILRMAARQGLTVAVVALELRPARSGRLADPAVLGNEATRVLTATLRRCDLVAWPGVTDQAVVLTGNTRVGEGAGRIAEGLTAAGLAPVTRIGVASSPAGASEGLVSLLRRARADLHPVLAPGPSGPLQEGPAPDSGREPSIGP